MDEPKVRNPTGTVVRAHAIHRTIEQRVSINRDIKSVAEQEDSQPEEYGEQKINERVHDGVETATTIGGNAARNAYVRRRIAREPMPTIETDTIHHSVVEQSNPTVQKHYRVRAVSRLHTAEFPHAEQFIEAEEKMTDAAGDMMQSFKRSYMVKEAVKRFFEKQAQNTVTQTVVHSAQVAKPVSVSLSGGTKTMVSRTTEIARVVVRWLRQLAVQAVKAVAESMIALLGAGGVVLVLALVVGAAAAVIGSPMGILFADESNDPNAIPIREIVTETNSEFAKEINNIVADHPECDEVDIQYDYEDGHTWASYWPEVLAVFAVNSNLNGDEDVVVIDEAKKEEIKGTFWMMHEIENEVEAIELPPQESEVEGLEDNELPSPEPQYRYILHITVSSRTVEQLADDFSFTQDQRDIMNQLLSAEMRPSLRALCGGVSAEGEMVWPVPGYTYISCHFGEPDAIRGNPHKGIDIPAPEGTPIVAAHSGTVMIAGWNDSYGNQVMIDNGVGLSTRYAHMVSSCVVAGATVNAGDVIGFVGSTGDSTGNHLHLELYNGGRVDPLLLLGR